MAADGEKGFLRKFGREGEGGKSPFREKKKKKTHKKQKRKGKILTARTEEKAETRESFTFKKKAAAGPEGIDQHLFLALKMPWK